MTHIFHHPKYYKKLRASLVKKSDQAISSQKIVDVGDSVRPGPGQKLQATSHKHQAPSTKLQAPSLLKSKLQASSPKQQASSFKPQASSSMILEPRYK